LALLKSKTLVFISLILPWIVSAADAVSAGADGVEEGVIGMLVAPAASMVRRGA
jgi:hypothetical protein